MTVFHFKMNSVLCTIQGPSPIVLARYTRMPDRCGIVAMQLIPFIYMRVNEEVLNISVLTIMEF